MSQTKTTSLVETIVSIVIGFTISCSIFYWVLPCWGHHYNVSQSIEVTTLFTVTSFTRAYFVRRFFNHIGENK